MCFRKALKIMGDLTMSVPSSEMAVNRKRKINMEDRKAHEEENVLHTWEMKGNGEEAVCLPQSALRLSIYADTFVGERLFMRPIFSLDYRPLKRCFGDEENMRYWGAGPCKGHDLKEKFVRYATLNLDKLYTGGWSIITHEGIAGCFWAWKNSLGTEVEISYVLSPQFSGRGLSTAAGKLVLQYRYEDPDFQGKIIATVHPDNKASQCVLEKLGLKPDPEKQNVPKFGSVRNYYQLEVAPPILYTFKKKSRLLDALPEQNDKKVNGITGL